MCDYSLETYKNEKAAKGETYKLTRFPSGSKGFTGSSDDTATCMIEGTVLRIDVPEDLQYKHNVTAIEDVVFTKLDKAPAESFGQYQDAVRFENGKAERLQHFNVDAKARVILLADASPKEDATLASETAATAEAAFI